MKNVFIIAFKELSDSLRDRRTMLMVFVITLLGMPFMMVVLSESANRYETQVEKKQIYVAGIAYAPML